MKIFNSSFGFLFDLTQIHNMYNANLLKKCNDLHILVQDVNSLGLFTELKNLCCTVPSDVDSPSETLKYLSKGLVIDFRNLCQLFALRILFTIPVTVASAEHFFSKLKLLKYLRSTMFYECFSAFVLIWIENNLANSIIFSETLLPQKQEKWPYDE